MSRSRNTQPGSRRYSSKFRGGNMVMAPSVSGIWDDERSQRGTARKAERRTQKRSERQIARRDIEKEV